MKSKSIISRLLPRSLLSRMLWLLLLAIVLAQSPISGRWMRQLQKHELDGMLSATRNLANSAAATITFFQSLPLQYRQIAQEQLRNMGGSRFFVSLNKAPSRLERFPDSNRKNLVINEVRNVLHHKLGYGLTLQVDFADPEGLHVFDNQTLLADIPPSWARHTLLMEPLNPPILVTQIELAKGEWLYLAALLPAPYMTLGKDIDQAALPEEGASEIVAVTRAINVMQHRIRRYIDDRERLFSSISHDLKTPITRLRLRVELLEDEQQISKFNKDLDDLEMMVKGALQTVKDTDIHENIELIDINQLLEQTAEGYNLGGKALVRIEGRCKKPYRGKPLALKRCISNLADNAITYGHRVRIIVMDDIEEQDEAEVVIVYFIDEGPGLPPDQLEKIFEPYYRLSNDTPGTGLGLGIARSIAHAHGGDLVLENRPQGGLQAVLSLPRH